MSGFGFEQKNSRSWERLFLGFGLNFRLALLAGGKTIGFNVMQLFSRDQGHRIAADVLHGELARLGNHRNLQSDAVDHAIED